MATETKTLKIAFVILTWNSAGYIRTCLDAVQALPPRLGPTLYLVDNGSTDDTCTRIGEFAAEHPETPVILIRNPQNLGTTIPRNMALRQLDPAFEYVCILDSDTKINYPAIEQLLAVLAANPRTLLAAPRMFNRTGEEQCAVKHYPTVPIKLLKGSPLASWNRRGERLEQYPFMPERAKLGQPDPDGPPVSPDQADYVVDYAISACWLLKPAALEIVGLLDEKIFYAPEDVDYCARIREAGYEVRLASGASIYHFTQRISKRKLISRMNGRHIAGLIHYFIKHRYWLNAGQIQARPGQRRPV